jgi:hypothetical protein
MPAPTLSITPVTTDDPKKTKKDGEEDKGKAKEESKDLGKQEEGEELVCAPVFHASIL